MYACEASLAVLKICTFQRGMLHRTRKRKSCNVISVHSNISSILYWVRDVECFVRTVSTLKPRQIEIW